MKWIGTTTAAAADLAALRRLGLAVIASFIHWTSGSARPGSPAGTGALRWAWSERRLVGVPAGAFARPRVRSPAGSRLVRGRAGAGGLGDLGRGVPERWPDLI